MEHPNKPPLEKVVRIDLKVEQGDITVTESIIQPHKDTPYQTQAMVKGFQMVDDVPHNRRVYLNKLLIPYVLLSSEELIHLEGDFGHVYAWGKDARKAKIALLQAFSEQINKTHNIVDDFLDYAPELLDSATNMMKYS